MEKQALENFAKEGFIKRAQTFGVSEVQANYLLKKANGIMDSLKDFGGRVTEQASNFYNNNREAVNTAGAGLAGAGVGAGIGGLFGGRKGALAGALGGGALGAGAGHMYQNMDEAQINKLKSYLGVDQQGPRSQRFDLNEAGTNDEFTQNVSNRETADNAARMTSSNTLARAIMPQANQENLNAYRQYQQSLSQPPLIPQSNQKFDYSKAPTTNQGTIGYAPKGHL